MNKGFLFFRLSVLCVSHPCLLIKNLTRENIRKFFAALSNKPSDLIYEVFRVKLNYQAQIIDSNQNKQKTLLEKKINELESKYPGITEPKGIANSYMLEEKIKPLSAKIHKKTPKKVNFFLPQLDPLIMFGGYISCLQFIRKLIESGELVRIILTETVVYDKEAVLTKLESNPQLKNAVSQCEVICAAGSSKSIVISPEDSFIAYSVWTAIHAHHFSQLIRKRFIFFIQEYEPIFHCHDSFYSMAQYAYRLPHYAIFNTTILEHYFKTNEIGIYAKGKKMDPKNVSVAFQHALTKTISPTISELKGRKPRRFLLYARPEEHAKRNLFEIALIGLKMAVFDGVFDKDEWEFIGVGTLGTEHIIPLGKDKTMFLTSTLPQKDYGESLKGFDIGMSLMCAPHPSIIPFEMASAGLVVITSTYGHRDEAVLKGISNNIVPCSPDMYSVANAISHAVNEKVNDYQNRIEGSKFDWVSDWDEAFNNSVMEKIKIFINNIADN